MTISFLKAFYGDCIHLSFSDPEGNQKNILIDGGTSDTYQKDKNEKGRPEEGALQGLVAMLRQTQQSIDLLIITHVDDDHIGGILKWFEEDKKAYELVKETWFNSGGLIAAELELAENPDLDRRLRPTCGVLTSIKQGVAFSRYITDHGIWRRELILQGMVFEKFGLIFKILSPDKSKLEKLLKNWKQKAPRLETSLTFNDYEKSLKQHVAADSYRQDTAYPNGSSIAFILTYEDKNFLFLGDSHPSVILNGLKFFKYDQQHPVSAALVKLAHHGSKGNTSVPLLKAIDASDYVISTNGDANQHPHKQFLARLIHLKGNANLYFNYRERMDIIFNGQDKADYPGFKLISLTQGLEF